MRGEAVRVLPRRKAVYKAVMKMGAKTAFDIVNNSGKQAAENLRVK
jgi:hypothetical protein